MRTRGEGGLEKIGDIWYFSYINLNGKQVRRSSGSKFKQVALEMLRKAKEELAKGLWARWRELNQSGRYLCLRGSQDPLAKIPRLIYPNSSPEKI